MRTTSEGARADCEDERGARRPHRLPYLLKFVLFALVAFAAVAALDYAIVPYGTMVDVAFQAFQEADDVDTVIVGSSYMQFGGDPEAFDTAFAAGGGTSTSYNIAASGGSVECMYYSVEEALQKPGVRRVVVGIGRDDLSDVYNLQSVFANTFARYRGKPGWMALAACARAACSAVNFDDANSVRMLTPFLYNDSHYLINPEAIAANVRRKRGGMSYLDVQREANGAWVYHGRGYGTYPGTIDTAHNTAAAYNVLADYQINSGELSFVRRICELCRERGVELVVVVPPQTPSFLLSYGKAYPAEMAQLRDAVEGYGFAFADFSLAKPELATFSTLEDFANYSHLSDAGAAEFSAALARYVAACEAGQDTRSWFYDYGAWDEWKASLPAVDSTWFDAASGAAAGDAVAAADATADAGAQTGTVDLTAHVWGCPGAAVEYRYALIGTDGTEAELRGWSEDAAFAWTPDAAGAYTVRVYARGVGSAADYDRYYERAVTV